MTGNDHPHAVKQGEFQGNVGEKSTLRTGNCLAKFKKMMIGTANKQHTQPFYLGEPIGSEKGGSDCIRGANNPLQDWEERKGGENKVI